MKKSIFAVAIAALMMMSVSVSAQGQKAASNAPQAKPTVEQVAQHRTDMMKKNLNLSDAQAKKIYDLNLKRAKEIEKNRTAAAADKQTRMDAMKSARAAEDAQMKSILTPEQYATWQQNLQKAAQRRDGMNGHKGGQGCKGGKGGKQGCGHKGNGCNKADSVCPKK